MKRFEIVIVGGGMTGLTLAAALDMHCYQHCNITVIDPSATPNDNRPTSPSFDDRSTALSAYTVEALIGLGITTISEYATAIQSIEVSDKGHLGYHLMESEAQQPFGHVIANKQLGALLWQAVKRKQARFWHSETVTSIRPNTTGHTLTLQSGKAFGADLVIVCDGGRSTLSEQLGFSPVEHPFRAHARVASVKTTEPHNGRAFERFTDQGPIALLPFGDFSALVWTLPEAQYGRWVNASKEDALSFLNETFGQRLGRITDISTWVDYPLVEKQLPVLAGHHFFALGNTAATLHPVAGQGFNLAIRGLMRAAYCINTTLHEHATLPTFKQLNELSNQILTDQTATALASRALIETFGAHHPGIQLGRGVALNALDRHPSASHWFSLASMGLTQQAPLNLSTYTGIS